MAIDLDAIPESHRPCGEVGKGEKASKPLGETAMRLFVLTGQRRDACSKSVNAEIVEHLKLDISPDHVSLEQVQIFIDYFGPDKYQQLIRHSETMVDELDLIERALWLAIKKDLIVQGLPEIADRGGLVVCEDWRVISRPEPFQCPLQGGSGGYFGFGPLLGAVLRQSLERMNPDGPSNEDDHRES